MTVAHSPTIMSYRVHSSVPDALLTSASAPHMVFILILFLMYRHLSTSTNITSDRSLRARLRKDLHGITEQLDVLNLEIDHQTALLHSLQNELRAKESQLASQAHQLALKDMTHKMSYMKLNRRNAMLAAQLKGTRKDMNDRSFAAFCERLLLTNKIWKAVKDLGVSAERIRALEEGLGMNVATGGVGADADEKRGTLVEELIQEIVDDLEESQKHVRTLLLRHDAEVKVINDGWGRDCRVLAQEVEQAKAGRRVSIVEEGGHDESDRSLDTSDEDDDMGSPTPTVLNDLEPESDPDATLLHITPHVKFKLSSMELEDLDLRSLPPPSLPCDEHPPPLDTFCLSCPTSSPICFSPTFHFSPLVFAPSSPTHAHTHPQSPNPTIVSTPTPSDRPISRYKRPHRDSYPSSNAALEALKGKLPMWPAHTGQLRASGGVSKKATVGRSAKRVKVGN